MLALILRLCPAVAGIGLIELGSANGARVILLKPVLYASAVEGMIARQLAAGLTIGTLLEANVAVRLLAFFFLWKVGNEVSRAALALGLLTWLLHEHTVGNERILTSEHRFKEAFWNSFSSLLVTAEESTSTEKLIHGRFCSLGWSLSTCRPLRACTHAETRDAWFTITSPVRDSH